MSGRFEFTRIDGLHQPRGEGRLNIGAADGAEVPGGRLEIYLGPRIIGGRYARLHLDDGSGSRVFAQALYNDGPYPGQNWVEIFDFDLPKSLGRGPGWELELAPYLRPVADAVPAGGHLMVDYEKEPWLSTQRALLAGTPPLATPLGALLYEVGSGDSFKDWYFPEGGQEGGRKLQGNKAFDRPQAQEMATRRARELESYLSGPVLGEPETDAGARENAARILAELRAKTP